MHEAFFEASYIGLALHRASMCFSSNGCIQCLLRDIEYNNIQENTKMAPKWNHLLKSQSVPSY